MRSIWTGLKGALVAAILTVAAPVFTDAGLPTGASVAQAQSSIVVRGTQRVEEDSVRSYMVAKSARASDGEIDESLKALYATGLFSDVRIVRSGGSLVVTVVESPLVNRISFEGNRRITDEQLNSVIETRPRGLLSRSRVQSDVQRLLEAYRGAGRFRAAVEPKVIELSQNRVDLVFEIDEGEKTSVTRINFVGNSGFSDGRLMDVIKTREAGLLAFLRTTDTYEPGRLQTDQELLRRFYLRNGYADFRILSATADLDRERNVFFVTFTLEEGERYTFGQIDVQSSLSGIDPGRMLSLASARAGNVYSAEDIEKTTEAISVEAARMGYPFVQVRPRATRDYEGRTISITFYVEEGSRTYVERIDVRGNTRTRDYVIRREFDMAEGDAFNRSLLDRAERRLRRLGFFRDVRINTQQGSSPDRVVIVVDVVEQPTGELSFGIGFSSENGVIGDLSFTEKNFLGRGQLVRAVVGGGESKRNLQFSFTEPYFMGQRLSAGFDVYQRIQRTTSTRSYDQETTGGTVRFGFPVTDEFSFGVGYSLFSDTISVARRDMNNGAVSGLIGRYLDPRYVSGTPVAPATACSVIGLACNTERTVLVSQFNWNAVYNTIDNPQMPRNGIFAELKQDLAGLGGDVQLIRTTFDTRYYREIWSDWGVVGMLRLKGGNVEGWGSNGMRTFDAFFIGGETIRGFASSGIGPRDARTRESLGAKNYVAATAQLDMPLPGVPEEIGLYGSLFADAGAAWGVDTSLAPGIAVLADSMGIRTSVGAGVAWRSPFGLLRADFGFALNKEKGDRTQVFRFSGGTQF